MAVTYAWRLDSNKFAYIVPPYDLTGNTVSDEYGFLSETPLTDYFLRAVSTTAESKFGKNGTQGLSGYTEAFAAMEQKIAEAATTSGHTQTGKDVPKIETFSGWTGMEKADLLSADVYYNVDSEDCADLRGVGIKGTRYLGAFPSINSGVDPEDIMFNTTLGAGMEGYTDVYGIYLTDDDTTSSAPEYMFVVRNGEKGEKGDKGDPLVITDDIRASLTTKSEFNALSGTVSTLETAVDSLNDAMASLTNAYKTISLDNVNNLTVMVSNLQRQINRLEQYLFGFDIPESSNGNNTDNGDSPLGGGGQIDIVPLGIVSGDDGVICNDYIVTATTDTEAKIEGWGGNDAVKDKKFHLLGYLEDDSVYLTTDEYGFRVLPQVNRLYALPNITVSLSGVTIGGIDSGTTTNVVINGGVDVSTNIRADGNIWGAAGLGTNGNTSTNTLIVSGNTWTETAVVQSGTTIGTTLTVGGKTTVNNDIQITGKMEATGGFYEKTVTATTVSTGNTNTNTSMPDKINGDREFSDEPNEA